MFLVVSSPLTRGNIALGIVSVFFNKKRCGQEEGSAHYGNKGTEQKRDLQRAELPHVGVRLLKWVWHLTQGGKQWIINKAMRENKLCISLCACHDDTYDSYEVGTPCVSQQVRENDLESLSSGAPCGDHNILRK